MKKFITLSFVFALSTASASGMQSCYIRIQSYKHNGETVKMAFETPLRSEEECATLAKMHRTNFSPSTIKSKSVAFAWSGKRGQGIASRDRLYHRRTR